MRVARSIGGSGEPVKSVRFYKSERVHERNEGSRCKNQEFNLLPQSVAYEIAVFLAFCTAGSSDDMI